MQKEIRGIYWALLKKGGKITRCEEVMDNVFAIEYAYPNHINPKIDMRGRGFLGDPDDIQRYFELLFSGEADIEKHNWDDDEQTLQTIKNATDRELAVKGLEEYAKTADRDLSTDPAKGIQTNVGQASKRRSAPNTVSPEW